MVLTIPAARTRIKTITAGFLHALQNPFYLYESIKNQIAFLIPSGRTNKKKDDTMIQRLLKPQIQGTRTGYVIRFTCPACHTENAIVNKTPREHFRATRDATCKQCRKRSTVLTPGINDTPVLSHVQPYYPCTKLQ